MTIATELLSSVPHTFQRVDHAILHDLRMTSIKILDAVHHQHTLVKDQEIIVGAVVDQGNEAYIHEIFGDDVPVGAEGALARTATCRKERIIGRDFDKIKRPIPGLRDSEGNVIEGVTLKRGQPVRI